MINVIIHVPAGLAAILVTLVVIYGVKSIM